MSRIFTMRKVCPACHCSFTITSAASVYCQNKDCQNKRRRDDYAKSPRRTGWISKAPEGSTAHLERALKSGD